MCLHSPLYECQTSHRFEFPYAGWAKSRYTVILHTIYCILTFGPPCMIWCDMIWYDMVWRYMIWYDTMYLLTAIGLTPSSSSIVHIYTQTVHRTTQNKHYIEQHNNFGIVWAVPRLCGFYPGICLTNEEKNSEVMRAVIHHRILFHNWVSNTIKN